MTCRIHFLLSRYLCWHIAIIITLLTRLIAFDWSPGLTRTCQLQEVTPSAMIPVSLVLHRVVFSTCLIICMFYLKDFLNMYFEFFSKVADILLSEILLEKKVSYTKYKPLSLGVGPSSFSLKNQ